MGFDLEKCKSRGRAENAGVGLSTEKVLWGYMYGEGEKMHQEIL